MANQVRDFLGKNNLNQYANKLFDPGYDDMVQLQEISSDELAEVIKEVGIFEKPGQVTGKDSLLHCKF